MQNDNKLISLSKEMAKDISYFFYRANKIYYMIEDLIELIEFKQRADIQIIEPGISIKSHIDLINEDIADLDRAIKSFYSTDIMADQRLPLFQDLFLKKTFNTSDITFQQHWYHVIQLVVECNRGYREEIRMLSSRNQEVNDWLYLLDTDYLIKNEINELLVKTSDIVALIQNCILTPLGSLKLRGYT